MPEVVSAIAFPAIYATKPGNLKTILASSRNYHDMVHFKSYTHENPYWINRAI